jgi:CRP/FNR family transcriptional regulator, cyclic AMP receptor protein
LTHGETAECIGTARETVTRTLSTFKHQIYSLNGATLMVSERTGIESMSKN